MMKKITKKIIKKIILLSAVFCTASFGAQNGLYIGGSAGYGILRTPNQPFFNTSAQNTEQRGGFSGRAFVGFNFTSYLGIEGGFADYARSQYQATLGTKNSKMRHYATAATGVVKGYLPLGCLNLYGLGGVAYVHETMKFSNGGISTNYAVFHNGNYSTSKARPIYGAGISYDATQHFTINTEATQIQRLGRFASHSKAIPFMNLYTAGLAYNFG